MADIFTYEDLFEFLRTEKNSADLQPINKSDLEKIKIYLEDKNKLRNKRSENSLSFNSKTMDNIQREIDNAKRVLIDLYQIRERKVINRALFCIRTESKIKDTTNMLETEQEQYIALIDILKKNNDSFFKFFSTTTEPKDLKEEKKEPEKEGRQKIELLEDTPEMLDMDQKTYGPFKKGEIIELPEELMRIILNNKLGKEV